MKSHKKRDPLHHYCRKCDYDAIDYQDMIDHKIQAMAPFLIGDKKNDKYKKMKHLCCEYCGEDFKSLEGRLIHRREVLLNNMLFMDEIETDLSLDASSTSDHHMSRSWTRL